jgi:hypothetical protein
MPVVPIRKEIQRRPQKTILGMDLWSFALIVLGLLVGLASLILLGDLILKSRRTVSSDPLYRSNVILITIGTLLC